MIEALRQIARHLDVLNLVATHRHAVGVEHQNVRRHQNRVTKQPHVDIGIGVFTGRHVRIAGGLISMRSVHHAFGRHAGQQPSELGYLDDVALAIKRDAIGFEPASQPHGRNFQTRSFNPRRVVTFHQRVVVGQKEKTLHTAFQTGLNGRAHGTNVIAEVGRARSGDAGEYALLHHRTVLG